MPKLEITIEIGTLGISGEEGSILCSGHVEVLVDFATLAKFQLQHSLFRNVADAGYSARFHRDALHLFTWMRMSFRRMTCSRRIFSSRLTQETISRNRFLVFKHSLRESTLMGSSRNSNGSSTSKLYQNGASIRMTSSDCTSARGPFRQTPDYPIPSSPDQLLIWPPARAPESLSSQGFHSLRVHLER